MGRGGGEEPEDYRCCECGCWVPEWTALDGLPDPWGYAMKMSTVRAARAWLGVLVRGGCWGLVVSWLAVVSAVLYGAYSYVLCLINLRLSKCFDSITQSQFEIHACNN